MMQAPVVTALAYQIPAFEAFSRSNFLLAMTLSIQSMTGICVWQQRCPDAVVWCDRSLAVYHLLVYLLPAAMLTTSGEGDGRCYEPFWLLILFGVAVKLFLFAVPWTATAPGRILHAAGWHLPLLVETMRCVRCV